MMLLMQNAENQVSWYIEGIGTVDSKTDNDTLGLPARGGGLGVGERGIAAKVTKGCIKGAEALRAKYRGKVINVLTVNVYGFSRGAAAARHFMHVATNAPTTQKLSKINYKYIHLKYLKNLIKKSVRNSFLS